MASLIYNFNINFRLFILMSIVLFRSSLVIVSFGEYNLKKKILCILLLIINCPVKMLCSTFFILNTYVLVFSL